MLLTFEDVGTGPAVVLIHGFPLDRAMWSEQFADLGASYRIIAPDLGGHGDSPDTGGTYTVDQMADDVLASLDHLGLTGPLVVGGLSMGGYVALSIAVRYPGRLRGLMILNSRADADSPQAAAKREETAQTVEREQSVASVVESMLPRLCAPATYQAQPLLIERLRKQMMESRVGGVANALRGLAIRPDRTPNLPDLTLPTMVLAGADDQMIPQEESRSMAARLPRASLTIVPGAGHLAPLENPRYFNAAVLDYLRSLDQAAR